MLPNTYQYGWHNCTVTRTIQTADSNFMNLGFLTLGCCDKHWGGLLLLKFQWKSEVVINKNTMVNGCCENKVICISDRKKRRVLYIWGELLSFRLQGKSRKLWLGRWQQHILLIVLTLKYMSDTVNQQRITSLYVKAYKIWTDTHARIKTMQRTCCCPSPSNDLC